MVEELTSLVWHTNILVNLHELPWRLLLVLKLKQNIFQHHATILVWMIQVKNIMRM